MSYTLIRVQEEFKEICSKAGVSCTTPIRLNGRLTRNLGRVTQKFNYEENRYKPSLVEFSKELLQTSTDTSIREVILHEACHYIVTSRTGELHSHDALFQETCKEIGASNTKANAEIQRTVPEESLYKYTIYCLDCQKFLGGYKRKCKTLEHISLGYCSCGRCGCRNLKINQNW